MPMFESYQRVFVTHALEIVNSYNNNAADTATRALASAQPYIVAFLKGSEDNYRPSDREADQLIFTFNELAPCPSTLMLRSRGGSPQRNIATVVRKLLSVIAATCNFCDVVLQYQRYHNIPLEDALKKASFRYCNTVLLHDAAIDTAPNSSSPDSLDNKAVGIIRHLGEDCLRYHYGYDQPNAVSDITLMQFVDTVLKQLYPPL
ncbi:MAG: hypothetical protein ACKO0Z_02330 [Betaproteobacteria bacterium]